MSIRSKKRKSPKVRPHWIVREFEAWLKTNRQRFSREPYMFKETNRGASYRFNGVSGRIELWMDCFQFLIAVKNGGCCVDLIWETDVALERTKSGKYICELCIPKYRKYYASTAALLSAHCFEPLIKWVDDKLRSENLLVINGEPRGWSSASVMNPIEAKTRTKNTKYERFRYPIILKNKGDAADISSGNASRSRGRKSYEK